MWVDDSVSPDIVGITAYAEQQLGELVFIDLPDEGTRVEAGDEVLELESAKAVEPLVCPVAGTIRYVNHDAADDPSVVNNDSYGERSSWTMTSRNCSTPNPTRRSPSDRHRRRRPTTQAGDGRR